MLVDGGGDGGVGKSNSYFWRSPPSTPTNTNINNEARASETLLHHANDSLIIHADYSSQTTLDTASAITDVSYHGHRSGGGGGREKTTTSINPLLLWCGATFGGLCLIDDE